MKDVAQLLNDLRDSRVISDYAIFGATAQMRYTEPVATLDADVLVVLAEPSRLDSLDPIYRYCEERGLTSQGEAILVGRWPVQFIPVFSGLTAEAVAEAERDDIEGVPVRVVGATHLAVIALSVGRAKDHLRIVSLLESGATTLEAIEALADRHDLAEKCSLFRKRYLDE
ncbi:MAG: hypothetical protein ABI779_21250 [Acidobacteriota bacterium]